MTHSCCSLCCPLSNCCRNTCCRNTCWKPTGGTSCCSTPCLAASNQSAVNPPASLSQLVCLLPALLLCAPVLPALWLLTNFPQKHRHTGLMSCLTCHIRLNPLLSFLKIPIISTEIFKLASFKKKKNDPSPSPSSCWG